MRDLSILIYCFSIISLHSTVSPSPLSILIYCFAGVRLTMRITNNESFQFLSIVSGVLSEEDIKEVLRTFYSYLLFPTLIFLLTWSYCITLSILIYCFGDQFADYLKRMGYPFNSYLLFHVQDHWSENIVLLPSFNSYLLFHSL